MKPIIGIAGSIMVDKSGAFAGYKRSYVNNDYIDAVINAGGIPYIIPFNTNQAVIKQQIAMVDGLILSGGHDVHPHRYGEEPLEKLTDTFNERDDFDLMLVEAAEAKKIPILGICRGFHIINVYHHGTLLQDLSYADHKLNQHWQQGSTLEYCHHVDLISNKYLNKLLNKDSMVVNSFHHQCINQLGEGLELIAESRDGICEGFINTQYDNLELGVQWHPEMLHRNDPAMQTIFNAIVEKSKA